MSSIIEILVQSAVEILTILILALFTVVLSKVKNYVRVLRKKDQIGIVDQITDTIVHLAETELQGKAGEEKRDFAIKKVLEILESRGIDTKDLSEAEIIAGIESGVAKMKALKDNK